MDGKLLMSILVTLNFANAKYNNPTPSEIVEGLYLPPTLEPVEQFFLRDDFSLPILFLVDDVKGSKIEALNLIQSLQTNYRDFGAMNISLMMFNSSGVSNLLSSTKNNAEDVINILRDGDDQIGSSVIGLEDNRTVVFFSILNAVHLLPDTSTLIIFNSRAISDEDLAQHALAEALKKEIKILVIWTGIPDPKKYDDSLLRQFAAYSGGNFVVNPTTTYHDEFYRRFMQQDSKVMTLFKKNRITDHFNITFPIDREVTEFHITISPFLSYGMLYAPNGDQINILNSARVVEYEKGSYSYYDPISKNLHIHINTTNTHSVGIWNVFTTNKFKLYNLTIFGLTTTSTEALIIFKKNNIVSDTAQKKTKLFLSLKNGFQTIRRIAIYNDKGKEIAKDLYNTQSGALQKLQIEKQSNISLDLDHFSHKPFSIVLDGVDLSGNSFKRQTYVKQLNNEFPTTLSPLTIEIGSTSELITQPGRQPQIYFEVTNNGNSVNWVRFYCSDKESILLSMSTYAQFISPKETVTVRVTLIPKSGTYVDLVTFTAQGAVKIVKTVNVDVGTIPDDRKNPTIDYHFASDCRAAAFSSCQDGIWSVDISAQDKHSGLLNLKTNPVGIYVNEYTTGTKEVVSGTYSASCCDPDVQIIAIDRLQNQKIIELNAYNSPLNPIIIIAIVIGLILIVVIILFIIWLIQKCLVKRKSYNLPIYRGKLSGRL